MNTKSNMIEIKQLRQEDINAVVEIHKDAFSDGLLTMFGDKSIQRYYYTLMTCSADAFAIGAWLNGNLAGFCFCGVFHGAFTKYVTRNRMFLIATLLLKPWLLFDRRFLSHLGSYGNIISKKIKRKFVPDKGGMIPNRVFGILSIAVHSRYRRMGVAVELDKASNKLAFSNGYEMMNLSVHTDNLDAIRFYEKTGWEIVLENNGAWNGIMERKVISEANSDSSLQTTDHLIINSLL